jgi:nicotinamidase-related amidase
MTDFHLNPKSTALVVIDMQKGIVGLPGKPYTTQQVTEQVAKLTDTFRKHEGFVVLVNVNSRDGKDMLHPITDAPPLAGTRTPDFAELIPELKHAPTDHLITKHQWGAFYGTDLDLQLRRRGIDTIVLCGIATNIGVETTAREAYQAGYNQVFAEDAMTGLSEEEHQHTVRYLFPRMGRIRTSDEIINALD